MKRTLFVISDLHLGGATGFQMCPDKGQARLTRFIDWVAGQKSEDTEIQLVLNGDIVDFLAEEDTAGGFSAFVVDEDEALRKLTRIAGGCKSVFAALKRFTTAGNRLILLIGNHDVELSLPAVRKHFLDLLGEARIEFLYDNEAFSIGPVLIEHGNRYDQWNMVNHGELRQIRSQLSRGEEPGVFAAQPGSELVARIMNPLKYKFAFVDLLKPETGAVLPILAKLDPERWRKVSPLLRKKMNAWYRGRFTDVGLPRCSNYIAADLPGEASMAQEQALPENLRAELDAADADAAAPPRGNCLTQVKDFVVDTLRKPLLCAFRSWRNKVGSVFDIALEKDNYLKPAREHAKRFQIVVFGHTHLAKRIDLGNGKLYLNTGTWADVMRIPTDVFEGDETAGMQAVGRFIDDVEKNNINGFRRQVATFARIELGANEQLLSADVLFFDDGDQIAPITTEGMRERLA